MNQILLLFLNIIYTSGFTFVNVRTPINVKPSIPEYKIPKWANKHFEDNKLSSNNFSKLKNITYDIPDWVHKEVFEYNRKLGSS